MKLFSLKMFEFKLLFFGDLIDKYSNSVKIAESISKFCLRSKFINWGAYTRPNQRRLLRRLDGNAFTRANLDGVKNLIIKEINEYKPNIIWLEKPLLVTAELISELKRIYPNIIWISRQDDNPFGGRKNEFPFWRHFIKAIPFYDFHFVKRESDWIKFRELGAPRLANFWVGYDSNRYFMSGFSELKKYDFSFIGTNMENRSKFLNMLQAELKTTNFLIAGANWGRSILKIKFPKQVITAPLTDEESRRIFSQSHASLGLFSTTNNDEFSSRIFLIAASGSVILAPRSQMHERFFQDKKEAFYFDNISECASIIKKLIANPGAGNEVGRNAAYRAKISKYSLDDVVFDALNKIVEVVASR